MPAPDWAPTLEQVAALIPQRTIDADANSYGGTFTSTTVPTDTAVTALIESVAARVQTSTGDVPDELHAAAGHATALRVAAHVELGYYANDRRYDDLKAEADAALTALVEAAQDVATSGSVTPDSGGSGGSPLASASFSFPRDPSTVTTPYASRTTWAEPL